MKATLVIAVIAASSIHGQEARSDAMRQKLHARVMELAPPPVPKPPDEETISEHPVLVMKPMVVESNRYRDVGTAIARDEQKKEEEKFSPVKGGTVYTKDFGRVRAELGSWWTPSEGWKFLKFSW